MSREPQAAHWKWRASASPAPTSSDEPTTPKAGPMRAMPSVPVPKRNPAPDRDLYKTKWSDMTPEEMASFRIYPKDQS